MGVRLADAVAYLQTNDDGLKQGLDEGKGKVDGWGSAINGVLMGAGMAAFNVIAGAAQAAVGYLGDSIGAASDMNETLSKTSVVFGENSTAVVDWANNAAVALGQSKQGALDAASTFGNLFVSMGMGKDTSADMSMGLVQLASDLGSFNNMDPTEVLDKLRSGLLGQTEPLQSLGVNMNAAMVQQKAMELGLAATTDALTPAMLAQARYALILDQTKTAQGDFARTSDGLANQQRIADAQWKDLQATIGQALLPVMLVLIQTMNQLVQAVLPPLAAFITEKVTPAMEAIATVIRATVGPALEAIMGWVRSLGDTMRTQTDGPFAYLQQWFEQNMPRIQAIVQTVLGAITAFWDEHGAAITRTVQQLIDWLVRIWDTQFRTILDIVQAILQLLSGDFEGAGKTLQGVVNRWWDLLKDAVTAVVTNVRNAWTSIDWGGIGKAILDGIAAGIRNGASAIINAAQDAAQAAFEAAKNFLGIHSPSKLAADEIGAPFAEGMAAGIRNSIAGLTGDINSGLSAMMNGLQPAAAGAATAAGAINISVVVNGAGNPVATGDAVRGGVLDALRSVGLS